LKQLIIILSCLLIGVACKKKKISEKEFAIAKNKPNELCLKMNGEEYVMIINTMGFTNDKFGFNFRKSPDNNIQQAISRLGCGGIELRKGFQTIYRARYDSTDRFNRRAGFSTSADGDAGGDRYDIIESDSLNNFISITDETNNFSEIRGNFSMTFVRIFKDAISPFPELDTVRFRDCTLHLFIR
jgi:hypothetical protein